MGQLCTLNGISNTEVIQLLNKAYADEWLSYLQYFTAAKVVKGIIRSQVEKELMEHAMEEFHHAERLAKRIVQLGGTPLLTPQEIIGTANYKYMEPKDPCAGMIVRQVIDSERAAVHVYRKMMEELHGKDQLSYHLAMDLMKDELDHEEDFQNFKEDLDRLFTHVKEFIHEETDDK